MSHRIFAIGRARSRAKKAVLPAASSVSGAGRRRRRPRPRTALPTLTGLALISGFHSRRRIAGSSEAVRLEWASSLPPVRDRLSSRRPAMTPASRFAAQAAAGAAAAGAAAPVAGEHSPRPDPVTAQVPVAAVAPSVAVDHTRRPLPPPAARRPGPSRPHAHRSAAAGLERRRARRRSPARILGWTLLAAGLLVLAGSAWVGWRTYQAYNHLQAASADVATLQTQLTDITAVDPEATATTVTGLQAESAAARSAVEDPIYRAASNLPFLGPNLSAIGQVTVTVDSLATDVMPSLVDVAKTLQPSELAPKDGNIDLAPIEQISPLLQSADVAVTRALAQVAGIDRSALVQPVGDAVQTLTGKLEAAADVTGPGARTARLLPPMLGAEKPRTYLVVFQNPAELRATGGIFGSYAVVEADRGTVSIVSQGASSRALGYFDPPVDGQTSNETALYTDLMARYPQDVNFTPDYPTAAALFAEMYRVRTGNVVDGVLALDPVALSYTLKGTPGIDVGQGVTITADNLVSTLLSTAYQRFDENSQADRDAFLDNATGTVFSDVMSGKGDPRAIIDGLRKAAGERRVLVYSADRAEQTDIEQTGLAGSLGSDPGKPSLGVFFNDGTAAKLGYYLNNEIHVSEGECRADGRRELQVRVVMKYDAPPDGLPPYVSGTTQPGQPYVLRTNVLAFAPLGGGVVSAQRDGNPVAIGRGEDQSREVGTTTIDLLPGTTTEVVFTVLGPAVTSGGPADVPPSLAVTPGVNPLVSSVGEYRSCTSVG